MKKVRAVPQIELIIVEEEMDGERLDVFVAEQVEQLSRSVVKSLINEGKILVNQERQKPSYRVREGDDVNVEIPKPQ